jgi:hypothetical protein
VNKRVSQDILVVSRFYCLVSYREVLGRVRTFADKLEKQTWSCASKYCKNNWRTPEISYHRMTKVQWSPPIIFTIFSWNTYVTTVTAMIFHIFKIFLRQIKDMFHILSSVHISTMQYYAMQPIFVFYIVRYGTLSIPLKIPV